MSDHQAHHARASVPGDGDQPEPPASELVGAYADEGAQAGKDAQAGESAQADEGPEGVQADESLEGAGTGGRADVARLAEAARQRDEYLDALRRLQAEFDNYRKRVERQHREVVDHAASSLVMRLLPVLDTADLALAHGGGEDVKQLAGALFETLAKEGLERIDPEGQAFDPQHHDAVAHEPADDEGPEQAEPQVSQVLRAGYRWKGRVLRPAMVKVRG